MLGTSNLNDHVYAILNKCTNLIHLKQLQAHLITLGHGQTDFYVFKLIRFCTITLNNLSYACSIFNYITTPNTHIYTAMITAYTSHSHHHSSVLLYREMVRKCSSKPNQFTFPIVLKSCPEIVKPFGIEMVHTQVEKCGFGQYPVVQTALLDAYSRFSSDIVIARRVFDEMHEKNVVSWTAMITGCTRVGDVGNAIALFDRVPREARDTPCWNSIIAGCAQNGMYNDAISFFKRMVSGEAGGEGIKPNKVTLICALSPCGHCGMLQIGKCIHGYIYRNNVRLDSFILNALVDMYGKCGSLREARRVFDKTKKESLTTWNSMINCLALHGEHEMAISFGEEMLLKNTVKPDCVTFVGLLSACTHGGLVAKGRQYFKMMIEEYGIKPEIQHYGCLIDLLGRAGCFEEAMELISEMKIPPDEVVWGSLLNGCRVHKQMDLAELSVKKLLELDPKNGGYSAMLANLYGEMGKWDEVRKVRTAMVDTNAYKLPGRSWIEVNNHVHQFCSVDKSHPKTEEIYNILACVVDSS
ncbi:hypothetical protein LIER_09779 [Lithospermum erythrorhizon]|uniref:Pentatricopeptide repeat-containing protein n=1 Tax=Lithospermum erythrorhizon TaxID=34254 RepID=A0AAV3PIY3_LITER